MRTAIELLLIIAAIVAIVLGWNALGFSEGHAEEYEDEVMYVICDKGDHVNIRMFPNRKQEPIGYLEPGDKVFLDGQKKNGFVHCTGLSIEGGEGWVHTGYLVEDEPEYVNRTGTIVSRGRTAARKYVNGKRTRWLKPMATVRVYYWSFEWCVTNCGYVRSEFIELDGE